MPRILSKWVEKGCLKGLFKGDRCRYAAGAFYVQLLVTFNIPLCNLITCNSNLKDRCIGLKHVPLIVQPMPSLDTTSTFSWIKLQDFLRTSSDLNLDSLSTLTFYFDYRSPRFYSNVLKSWSDSWWILACKRIQALKRVGFSQLAETSKTTFNNDQPRSAKGLPIISGK